MGPVSDDEDHILFASMRGTSFLMSLYVQECSRKLSSWELVKRYYNWDADHQTMAGNYPELIRENKEENYLL